MQARKPPRKAFIITIIAVTAALSGYILYHAKKQSFLDHQLKNLVKEKTNELYNISYDSISLDEVAGNLYVKNVYIKGDTSRELQMINSGDTNAAKILLNVYVPIIKVVGFKTAGALISKHLNCREIIVSDPKVDIYVFPGAGKQKDPREQQEELYKQILGNFKLIKADSVSIINSQVTASDFFTKEIKFKTIYTTVNLNDVAIDSTYNQDTSRTLFCKQIAIRSDKIILGEKKNTAEIERATFDTRSKIVAFSSFSYDAFKNKGFFKTRLQGISLQGIEWKGPVENSELVIDKAIFSKGDVESLSSTSNKKDPRSEKPPKILTGWIRSFSLNTLLVKSVTYTSRPVASNEKPFTLKNNSFLIKNVQVNRQTLLNETFFKSAKEIEVTNAQISLKSADNFYEYRITGIKLNTFYKTIYINSVRVIPQLNEAAFARKKHYQSDRYDINFRNIECSGVNVEKLIKGEVDVETINTSGNSIKVFRDLSYPIDSISRQGQQQTYPHQLVHKLSFFVTVKKFLVKNSYIQYKEKEVISHNSGVVKFSNSNLTITNISNHKARASDKSIVTFTTSFLDKIPLAGHFVFYKDKWGQGTFSAQASVSTSIDATIFNQLAEPMGMARVEKGEIGSIRFSMMADTNTSHATLQLPYKDLKISLLKKKGDEYARKGITSLLANILVRNNNKEGENMRVGKASLHRNRYRSFFNFIWMSIFTAMKDVCMLKKI